jgi:hypothetical protein
MIINPYVFGAAFDPDAQAFITAAGITDNTQKTAINTLVLDMKGFGIWTKMKAIYPMVGGTATTHKWNLKDPQDTNAAFRLVFNGGWTHSSTGALPNGTNGYADTFLDSTNNLSLNSGHMSYYSRTNLITASFVVEIGSLAQLPDSYTGISTCSANQTHFRFNNFSALDVITATTTLGFFTGSRTASNIIKTFRNGSLIINGTAGSNTTSTRDYYIGASNFNGTASFFSSKECAFSSIGDGLTDTEAANFYTAVQNFNTTLTRNV